MAGRPYAEKLKSLKEGDVSMGKNVAKEEDEQSPGKTPRWMHDMYMSPWELHERLSKNSDVFLHTCMLQIVHG